ncbi:MAG: endonuclease/exonuclease/phosphatase family protein [Chloroflexi bacterium]|nr:endonuclease/exonuclease/phosphatase family protein [Chloroflexota bacterium]
MPGTRFLRVLLFLSLLYPALLLVLNMLNLLLHPQAGALGMSEVFAPFLFLPLALLIPLLFVRGFGLLRVAFVCCLVVWALRFMPPLNFAPPPETAAVELDLMTWNMYVNNDPQNAIDYLQQKPAPVVVLQETSGEWLADDDTLKKIYPYQLRYMQGAPAGLVLLSSYPIVNYNQWDSRKSEWDPNAVLWAELELAPGKTVIVATAHPNNPDLASCKWPFCFEPGDRNQQISNIFSQVDQLIAQKKPLILAGDFNTTQWEPAYKHLTANLQDTYLKAGLGWGATWRPFELVSKFPVLRIDYILATPDVVPLKVDVDCANRGSDHCVVTGQYGIE